MRSLVASSKSELSVSWERRCSNCSARGTLSCSACKVSSFKSKSSINSCSRCACCWACTSDKSSSGVLPAVAIGSTEATSVPSPRPRLRCSGSAPVCGAVALSSWAGGWLMACSKTAKGGSSCMRRKGRLLSPEKLGALSRDWTSESFSSSRLTGAPSAEVTVGSGALVSAASSAQLGSARHSSAVRLSAAPKRRSVGAR